MSLAIIIISFNRPNSLKNLLNSISLANYSSKEIPLVISIDYQNSIEHNEVLQVAKEFDWGNGSKEIIEYKENLGLKEHVLRCGDLVNKFNSIIMLEDDLFVSPSFYTYTAEALSFYGDDNNIGGISLYNHKRNFLNNLPFELIPDSNDVYFLQIACSWGQAWTKKQWNDFRTWHKNNNEISVTVPIKINNWPESSWLKHYINYLVTNNLYFVYPNKSLTTNFGDSGTNNTNKNTDFQVPIFHGKSIRFTSIKNSLNVYDSFFEILPSCIKSISPVLKKYDFTVDLYGTKPLAIIKTKYLISSKNKLENAPVLFSYGLEMKPMVLNLIYHTEGAVFNLSERDGFSNDLNGFSLEKANIFNFFIVKFSFKNTLKIFFSLLNYKILKK
jgi:hypothetical protein